VMEPFLHKMVQVLPGLFLTTMQDTIFGGIRPKTSLTITISIQIETIVRRRR
jgi:hypothetical protein